MGIIYCGEENHIPYYIKEADIKIYSLQELAYFIIKYPMLISNNFINKNLIQYININLKEHELYQKIIKSYDTDDNIVEKLVLIIKYSGLYAEDDIKKFIEYIDYLESIEKDEYIKISADSLYRLKKYNKAIQQYQKIPNNILTYRLIGYSYAKLLNFRKAIEYLEVAYLKEKNLDLLKDIYTCCKLNKNLSLFDKYREYVTDERVADWEYDLVKLQLTVKNSKKISQIDDIFMMGDNYIKENVSLLINNIKEKYRYV